VVNPFRANATRRFNPSTRETALKPRDTVGIAEPNTLYTVYRALHLSLTMMNEKTTSDDVKISVA